VLNLNNLKVGGKNPNFTYEDLIPILKSKLAASATGKAYGTHVFSDGKIICGSIFNIPFSAAQVKAKLAENWGNWWQHGIVETPL